MHPRFAKNFQSFVALAPITFLDKERSLLVRALADADVVNLMKLAFVKKFLFLSDKEVSPLYGKMVALAPNWMDNLMELVTGFGKNTNLTMSRQPVMASHEPGGTSLKNV